MKSLQSWQTWAAILPILLLIGNEIAKVFQHRSDNELEKIKSDNERKLKEQISKNEKELQENLAKTEAANKIELQNLHIEETKKIYAQANYERLFPRMQYIFENYINTTLLEIKQSEDMPINFSEKQKHLESLVLLYSPETASEIRYFNDIIGSNLDELIYKGTKEEKLKLARSEINEGLTNIISSLSKKVIDPAKL